MGFQGQTLNHQKSLLQPSNLCANHYEPVFYLYFKEASDD
jgi:hypothetical protein